MTLSIYVFERTELRTMQNMCGKDNDASLNMVANLVGELNVKLNAAKTALAFADERIRALTEDEEY